MESSMEVPQKTENKTAIRCSNYTCGYLSKEEENANLRRYMLLRVHCSITYSSQGTETSTDEWMAHVCSGLLFSHKKEGRPAVRNSMVGTAEWGKSEEDKYHMMSLEP